jgi:hypothetical protein
MAKVKHRSSKLSKFDSPESKRISDKIEDIGKLSLRKAEKQKSVEIVTKCIKCTLEIRSDQAIISFKSIHFLIFQFVLAKVHHLSCFHCGNCQKVFEKNETYYEKKNQPWCEKCFYPKASVSSDSGLKFICSSCNLPLAEVFTDVFFDKNNRNN